MNLNSRTCGLLELGRAFNELLVTVAKNASLIALPGTGPALDAALGRLLVIERLLDLDKFTRSMPLTPSTLRLVLIYTVRAELVSIRRRMHRLVQHMLLDVTGDRTGGTCGDRNSATARVRRQSDSASVEQLAGEQGGWGICPFDAEHQNVDTFDMKTFSYSKFAYKLIRMGRTAKIYTGPATCNLNSGNVLHLELHNGTSFRFTLHLISLVCFHLQPSRSSFLLVRKSLLWLVSLTFALVIISLALLHCIVIVLMNASSKGLSCSPI